MLTPCAGRARSVLRVSPSTREAGGSRSAHRSLQDGTVQWFSRARVTPKAEEGGWLAGTRLAAGRRGPGRGVLGGPGAPQPSEGRRAQCQKPGRPKQWRPREGPRLLSPAPPRDAEEDSEPAPPLPRVSGRRGVGGTSSGPPLAHACPAPEVPWALLGWELPVSRLSDLRSRAGGRGRRGIWVVARKRELLRAPG